MKQFALLMQARKLFIIYPFNHPSIQPVRQYTCLAARVANPEIPN